MRRAVCQRQLSFLFWTVDERNSRDLFLQNAHRAYVVEILNNCRRLRTSRTTCFARCVRKYASSPADVAAAWRRVTSTCSCVLRSAAVAVWRAARYLRTGIWCGKVLFACDIHHRVSGSLSPPSTQLIVAYVSSLIRSALQLRIEFDLFVSIHHNMIWYSRV